MGSACTSYNDKEYKKFSKTGNLITNIDDPNKMSSKDFQVYQLIKKEAKNEIISFLNIHNIDINEYIFDSDLTILHRAIHLRTSPQYIEFLIEKGSKIENVEIKTMNTPLYIACFELNPEIVSTLLNHSPNIYHKNNENKNLFDILDCMRSENFNPIQFENYKKIVKMIDDYKRKLHNTVELDYVL